MWADLRLTTNDDVLRDAGARIYHDECDNYLFRDLFVYHMHRSIRLIRHARISCIRNKNKATYIHIVPGRLCSGTTTTLPWRPRQIVRPAMRSAVAQQTSRRKTQMEVPG